MENGGVALTIHNKQSRWTDRTVTSRLLLDEGKRYPLSFTSFPFAVDPVCDPRHRLQCGCRDPPPRISL